MSLSEPSDTEQSTNWSL